MGVGEHRAWFLEGQCPFVVGSFGIAHARKRHPLHFRTGDRKVEELSLHILDIAENALRAAATRIDILITEDTGQDLFTIEIADNGRGMASELAASATDPFVTTRKERRVGLGLPLLEQAAKATGGSLTIESKLDQGTCVTATFRHSHLDRQPLGDIAETLVAILLANPDVRLVYTHRKDDREIVFDADDVRSALGSTPISAPDVIAVLRRELHNLEESLVASG